MSAREAGDHLNSGDYYFLDVRPSTEHSKVSICRNYDTFIAANVEFSCLSEHILLRVFIYGSFFREHALSDLA